MCAGAKGWGAEAMWRISKGRIDRLVVFAGDAAAPVGELLFEGAGRGGARQSIFRYARSWLTKKDAWPLDPAGLALRRGAVSSLPHEVPLIFYDAAPDGWGRGVLRAAFPKQIFGMAEYLAASGTNRTGDLAFGFDENVGPERWVPDDPALKIPDGTETLADLLDAAAAVEEGRPRLHHLQMLCDSAVDFGGARPKAGIVDGDKSYIAKFPAMGDPFDDPRMEGVCLSLAEKCGIDVPKHLVVKVGEKSVLLVERFDRGANKERRGYMCAGTLVRHDPLSYSTNFSYSEVAIRAREAGITPCESDLFRRLLFNRFIHNTDDHLRNHGFYRKGMTWELGPAFDLVPHRQVNPVMSAQPGAERVVDPLAAFEAHPHFRLTREKAARIYDEVVEGLKHLTQLMDDGDIVRKDRGVVARHSPKKVK